MLDAATAMVGRAGLTVSLDHLSFEDLIRDARVSRSSVYRRWPYKDLFFADLLRELAKASTPARVSSEEASLGLIGRLLLEHIDWLATEETRRRLLLELIREGGRHDFETMHGSPEWRTYIGLHATFLSVADDALREDLRRNLAATEQDFVRRIAASWKRLSQLLGYRLRPEYGLTFEFVAAIASADLRGHVLMALANPELATRTIRARPEGAAEVEDWSPSALAIASIAVACFEPDPAITWDAARVAAVRREFEAIRGGVGFRAPIDRG